MTVCERRVSGGVQNQRNKGSAKPNAIILHHIHDNPEATDREVGKRRPEGGSKAVKVRGEEGEQSCKTNAHEG